MQGRPANSYTGNGRTKRIKDFSAQPSAMNYKPSTMNQQKT